MAAPRDSLGNPLAEKDLIMVEISGKFMLAQVRAIDEGGALISAQGQKAQPGKIAMSIDVIFGFNPGGGKKVAGIVKVQQPPDSENAIPIPAEPPREN